MSLRCRLCSTELTRTFVDLGHTPLANSFLTREQLADAEPCYPLHARVCEKCFLVQVEEFESPGKIFGDYAYFSSYSQSWLRHASEYCARMVERLGLGKQSLVVEIASNDGYLLQYFLAAGTPVLGIEPAGNVARAAAEKGIPTMVRFFGVQTAQELVAAGKRAHLLIGNNVLAHVPDLNDFVAGMKMLLAPQGVITLELPHLLRLICGAQFDTIYHEHFSYFSFRTVEQLLAQHGLTVFDVEELATHGGSLRVFACHREDEKKTPGDRVRALRKKEEAAGLFTLETYSGFARHVQKAREELRAFLAELKRSGKTTAGYGAPAKGNTLLNYCGIGPDLLPYTVDTNPYKQNRFLPGSHIPVYAPERIRETRPEYLLILPWNLREEVLSVNSFIREWGGKFVVPIPRVEVIP